MKNKNQPPHLKTYRESDCHYFTGYFYNCYCSLLNRVSLRNHSGGSCDSSGNALRSLTCTRCPCHTPQTEHGKLRLCDWERLNPQREPGSSLRGSILPGVWSQLLGLPIPGGMEPLTQELNNLMERVETRPYLLLIEPQIWPETRISEADLICEPPCPVTVHSAYRSSRPCTIEHH